jgi:hypothetical protein
MMSLSSGGFLLKSWDVTVHGYGVERIVAATRGKALAKAWRCDAFNRLTFGDFLKIASAWRAMLVSENFGAPITVDGKPAFFVDRNRQYVQIAYPGGEHVLSAHPYDVEPQSFRPEAYRDSGSDPSGENSRSEVECEASQSGGEAASPNPSQSPKDSTNAK